tara:strand:- start:214 stop:780 length:567 start_codon:yes stop_codon:yes gene_type:complete
MKSSRERNILIAVLGVAGLGLLVDRVIIGSDVTGPAESSAGVIDAFDPAQADPANLLITQDEGSTVIHTAPTISLAQRLRETIGDAELAEPEQTRNAFMPVPGWLGDQPAHPGTPDNTTRQLIQDFKAKHPLEAVMVVGGSRYAVIAGQTIHIGQQVDGYKLVAVNERSATFQLGMRQFEVGITDASP